jgi:hypothetical protein
VREPSLGRRARRHDGPPGSPGAGAGVLWVLAVAGLEYEALRTRPIPFSSDHVDPRLSLVRALYQDVADRAFRPSSSSRNAVFPVPSANSGGAVHPGVHDETHRTLSCFPFFTGTRRVVDRSELREHGLERTRHAVKIERIDEHRRCLDLSPARGAEESAELFLSSPTPPFGLPLKRAKRRELAPSVDDAFDARGAEGANELLLQVRDAHVEAEPLHFGASEQAETGPIQAAAEITLLGGVAQTGEPEVQALGPEQLQEGSNVARPSHRHDRHALGLEMPVAAPGERLQRALVADALDEHDSAGEYDSRGGRTVRVSGARRPVGRVRLHT